MKKNILRILIAFFILIPTCYPAFAQEAKEEEALFVAKKAFDDSFYEASRELLERFLTKYPNSIQANEARLLIGQCYFYENNLSQAQAQFKTLINTAECIKNKDTVLYWLAETYFRLNDYKSASSLYLQVIKEFPNSVHVSLCYYSLGWCLFQEHDYTKAIEKFLAASALFSNDNQKQEASYKIIECLYNLKDYRGLKERIRGYFKLYPKDISKNPYLHFYLGESNYYLNNFEEAALNYTESARDTSDKKIQAIAKLGLGWCYLKTKQFQKAEETLNSIEAPSIDNKGKESLLLGKANLYFETSRLNEAKDCYEQLAGSSEDQAILAQAYAGWAGVLYKMADYKEAESKYRMAMKESINKGPQSTTDKLSYELGLTLMRQRKTTEAIDRFQKLADTTDDVFLKISSLCQIAEAYQSLAKFDLAISTYNSIASDYPDSAQASYALYKIASGYISLGNLGQAEKIIDSLAQKSPDPRLIDEVSYNLGLGYYNKKNYTRSREIFDKLQSRSKDESLKPQITFLLGTSLYSMGDFAKAIDTLKNVSRFYNQDSRIAQKAEYEIADAYYQLGKEDEALSRFIAMRSKYSQSVICPEVNWWLAEYYNSKNNPSLASRYYLTLINDYPNNSLTLSAYYSLGILSANQGRYTEALDYFYKVAQTDKSDYAVQARTKAADILTKLKNYDDALKLYGKAVATEGTSSEPDTRFKMAEILEIQGKLNPAAEEYLKSAHLFGANNQKLSAKSMLRAAAIYEAQNNFKDAQELYKEISAMDIEEAKYAKERLEQFPGPNGKD